MKKEDLLLKQARMSSIPDKWKLARVGDVCSVRNDLRKPVSVDERALIQGPYPYYGPTGVLDFINEFLVEGEFALIGEDGDHFLKPDKKPQTIYATGRFNVNNHAHLIESTATCSSVWFVQFFKHRNITDFLSRQGANRYKLNKATLEKLPILLPPLPEQKAIANLLSTWDEAIEKTERLIHQKEKQFRQTARWALFGHKRLNNGPIELSDGHFFKYPCDWSLVKIIEIAKEVSERNGEPEETTVLSCSKYDGFVNSLDYFGKQVFSSDTSNYKVIRKGQFGYPSNHVEEGSIGLLEHCEKGIVSPIYIVFEVSKEKIHPLYLFKLLKTDIFKHIFQVCTSSSVDRRGSLRWGDFSKIKIPLPSLQEQQQIAETLSTAQQEIDLLKQLANKYRTQKRGLMQKMLTGTWRVKTEILNKYTEA
jgi:type I restriction enzyme S subunit